MRALRIPQPNLTEVIDLPIPEPGPGDMLIRVMASGICGTDVHILRGEYLGGYPVIPGHEFAGVVEAVGEGVTRYQVGERVAVEPNIACGRCVHCLNNRQNFCENWRAVGVTLPGGMAQYTLAPQEAVFPIGEMPFEVGAFVEPLSCVIHGLIHLDLAPAASVLVIGAGPIGILLLRGLRLMGTASVTVAERNPARLAFARVAGADVALDDLGAAALNGFDAVIDATGVPAVMTRSLDYARPGGKLLWFGVPPSGARMELEPFKIFQKGLTLMGSFTSLRNSYQAVDWLRSGRMKVDDLVSHRLGLEEFERGVQLIERGNEDVRKVMILPNG